MLIQYGLFDEARDLFELAGNDATKDFDLALMGIALTLTNAELSSACLDIKTLDNQFQNMPAWRELSHYCTARFDKKNTLSAADLKFEHYPLLESLLVGDLNYMPDDITLIEQLISFADSRISENLYEATAKSIEGANDLFVKLALNDTYKDNQTYQCYVIESAARGINGTDQLASLYQQMNFPDAMMAKKKQSVTMHPCAVPAFFFQRLSETKTPEIELPILLQSVKGISIHALSPFAPYIENSYDLNGDFGWDASLILALNNKKLTTTDTNTPIVAITKNESMSQKQANQWKQHIDKRTKLTTQKFDTALPVYISRINSGDFSYLDGDKDKFNYENLFSLTYNARSLHSGIGINDALSHAMDEDNIPRALLIALSSVGHAHPKDIHPNAIAVILSSFSEYKLYKEKHTLSIEALH